MAINGVSFCSHIFTFTLGDDLVALSVSLGCCNVIMACELCICFPRVFVAAITTSPWMLQFFPHIKTFL